MLPKIHRLSRLDFNLVYKSGRRVRGEAFGLAYLPAENKNKPSKIGIVVGKNFFKKAADRNRIKRQIRSILIKDVAKTLSPGKKIVLTVFSAPKTNDFKVIKEEIISLMSKVA